MVEIVIALLMYIGIDLKEHVPYDNIGDCLKAKRLSERSSGIDAQDWNAVPSRLKLKYGKKTGKNTSSKLLRTN